DAEKERSAASAVEVSRLAATRARPTMPRPARRIAPDQRVIRRPARGTLPILSAGSLLLRLLGLLLEILPLPVLKRPQHAVRLILPDRALLRLCRLCLLRLLRRARRRLGSLFRLLLRLLLGGVRFLLRFHLQ